MSQSHKYWHEKLWEQVQDCEPSFAFLIEPHLLVNA